MFTGIIEALGEVSEIKKSGTNLNFTIKSNISDELKVDQSIAHNGVCLTVTKLINGQHCVTAVEETLNKTNLVKLGVGHVVNLERCMVANGRFDGHIVQGHVDQTAVCVRSEELDGSWLFEFEYDRSFGNVTVEKGSITINGISLTCFNSVEGRFTVTIIPYTMENTDFGKLKVNDTVNLEFDIIGKYVSRLLNKG
ncbi:MAG: riboflavin synthase [Cyclobacteriaceae bacterium]|jgi:riboflavin synthase